MATVVFFADQAHKRRGDGRNTIVASGASVAAARVVAETLLGQVGALADFTAVDISGVFPAFVVEGRLVGARGQSVWPSVTRGGDSLPGS